MTRRVIFAALALNFATVTVADAQELATELRENGRAAIREGRFQAALSAFQLAAFQTRDPTAWLEVADAADRLRENAAALDAYRRYLAARPEAPDRVEITARIQILEAVVSSGRRSFIGEAMRRGIMPTSPSPQVANPIGESGRRGIIPASEIIQALRRGTHVGRSLDRPSP